MNKKILVIFPKTDVHKPVINELIKDNNLSVSILRAQITPEEEGHMMMELIGEEKDIKAGLKLLKKSGSQVFEAEKGLQWNKDKCIQCGNCISHCPTDALSIVDRETMEVAFNSDTCIECLSCIKNCPFGACASIF